MIREQGVRGSRRPPGQVTWIWRVGLIVAVLSGLVLNSGCDDRHVNTEHCAYWIWAGITPEDAPPDSDLLVFQGHFRFAGDSASFERGGLYPFPIKCQRLTLVYRLEGQKLQSPEVIERFLDDVKRWQRHPVAVSGIQLDFDSPTAKLPLYSSFLEEIRTILPSQFGLSVTGLGDWVLCADPSALRSIAGSVDEIVFQLYQGRQPLPDIGRYLAKLSDYPLPFRVGLLLSAEAPSRMKRLSSNPNYGGFVYFIQR